MSQDEENIPLASSGTAGKSSLRFKLLSGAELCAAPPMQWMVRGILPMHGLAAIYGPSTSGKSFLALDLAAAIAGGATEWFGYRVRQCPVIYVWLEGEAGIRNRIEAWRLHHEKPIPEMLRFITASFLLSGSTDVDDLAQVISGIGDPGLIIIDTLNRATTGTDENSSADMGRIIAAASRLAELTSCLVLLVHHTGKDPTRGLRGHSSLLAALDGAIEVSRDGDNRKWKVAKSKDGQDGAEVSFKLHVQSLGEDEDGEPLTSCVVIPDDTASIIRHTKIPQGKNQRLVLAALRCLFDEKSAGNPENPSPPSISMEEAIATGAAALDCHSDRRTSRAKEAIRGLINEGMLKFNDGRIWMRA